MQLSLALAEHSALNPQALACQLNHFARMFGKPRHEKMTNILRANVDAEAMRNECGAEL